MSFQSILIKLSPAITAILLAIAAQFIHNSVEPGRRVVFLFAAAVILWLFALITRRTVTETRVQASETSGDQTRTVPTALVVSVVVLAFLTFLFSGENAFTSDNVLAWTLSIAVFLYAFWLPEKNSSAWRAWMNERIESLRGSLANGFRVPPQVILLAAILVAGVIFYYHNLDGVPAEMTSDHAEKLLDVNDVVNNNLSPIFFERNTGREPLQFYLTAFFINLTDHPIDHMALKLITAGMGVLVVLGTFLFARELFGDKVAFITAALIAVGKWPLGIARIGLRYPFAPLFVAPLMFFLIRALKYRRRNDFLIVGLLVGAGLYGYSSFRIVPLLVAACIALAPLVNQKIRGAELKHYAINTFLAFALTLVVLMPLARYGVEHPGNLWYRVATRVTDAEQPMPTNVALTFAKNVLNLALMFNWSGDTTWPTSIVGDPVLDFITGGFFLLGVVYVFYRLVTRREWTYAFILFGLSVTLLPSALSIAFPGENPSTVRTVDAIPFVFIIAALPLAWLVDLLEESFAGFAWGKVATIGVMVLIWLGIAGANYIRYFQDYDAKYREASWNSSEVAAAIHEYGGTVSEKEYWILLYPHWIDTRAVAIWLGHIERDPLLNKADDALANANDSMSKLYVLSTHDDANLNRLEEIFPSGQQRLYHSRTPDHDSILFYVPGTLPPAELMGAK